MADETPVRCVALERPLTFVGDEQQPVETVGIETVKIEHVFIQSD